MRLKEMYVIVKWYGGEDDYFTDKISPNKALMMRECRKMNKQYVDKYPMLSNSYIVETLDQALEKYKDSVRDYYTEVDESY